MSDVYKSIYKAINFDIGIEETICVKHMLERIILQIMTTMHSPWATYRKYIVGESKDII